jgi:peptidoglycan/LPS O-acetylase OafA/YrhL
MTPPSNHTTRVRFEWADAYKGVAILFVVMIHVFGRFMGLYPVRCFQWYVIGFLHGIADCAVPAFLLLSVIVNANSLLLKKDYRRYYINRLQTIAYPYVIWSVLYYFLYIRQKGFSFSLFDLFHLILIGKAYDHLYFLWVLLQIIVVLPFLIPIFRKMPVMKIILSIIALNLCVKVGLIVILHSNSLLERSALRYIPMILMGIYLASKPRELSRRIQQSAPWIILMVMIAGFFYIPDSMIVHNHESRLSIISHSFPNIMDERGNHFLPLGVNANGSKSASLHNSAQTSWHAIFHAIRKSVRSWFFTLLASLSLMLLAIEWSSGSRLKNLFELIGEYSLQIYLFHPMVLLVLDRLQFVSAYIGKFLTMILYILFAILLSYMFAKLAERLRISRFLFGR